MASDEPYFRSWDCICPLGKHVWCPVHGAWEEYKRPAPELPAESTESKLDF